MANSGKSEEEMPDIDQSILNAYFGDFCDFVKKSSGVEIRSFSDHPYLIKQENYKSEVWGVGRNNLDYSTWKRSNIGAGSLISKTISAIEIPNNNLVPWQNRYGAEVRYHQSLYEAKRNKELRQKYETVLYDLFCNSVPPSQSFSGLVELAGKKYAFIAYLFFLKDCRTYLPIAPLKFDRVFSMLGIDFTTTKNCSWENYITYNRIIAQVRKFLTAKFESEVRLLDAHSFLWILGSQMKDYYQKGKYPTLNIEGVEYLPQPFQGNERENKSPKQGGYSETDYLEAHRVRIQSGQEAEDCVLKFEQTRLHKAGKENLAQLVKKVSSDASLGYDILSYEDDSTPIQIEVKKIDSFRNKKSFIITQNELAKSSAISNYQLYLVLMNDHFDAKIYIIRKPNLNDQETYHLEPLQYRVTFF